MLYWLCMVGGILQGEFLVLHRVGISSISLVTVRKKERKRERRGK